MEQLKSLIGEKNSNSGSTSKMTDEEYAEYSARRLNATEGDLKDGFDCPVCKNKGIRFVPQKNKYGWNTTTVECECMKQRASIRRLKRSGLEHVIESYTFDTYEVKEKWQQVLKDGAIHFSQTVNESANKWMFIGGGVGCGKTHLCTAVAGNLLNAGKELKYMLWVDESAKIKACVNDSEKYAEMVNEIKTAEVLYIDDLFKVEPTQADVKLAYEIINFRYQNPDLITIISSERYISEIESMDSAIGSRIYERSKGHSFNIKRDKGRNFRTKDMAMI